MVADAFEGALPGADTRSANVPLAVLAGAVVVGPAAAGGGYFPSSWGWLELLVLAVAVWAIAGGAVVVPARLEVAFVGSFALLTALAATSDVNEAARTAVYATTAAAALAFARRRSAFAMLAGILGGATAVAVYALATRLFPDRIGTFDSIARYRLSTPVGYWNALGLLCALAVLLAIGLAASAGTAFRAALAGSTVPPAAVALYFTFSRGSWLALAIGLAVAVALDPRRLRLSAFAAALAAPAALAVWPASRSPALTHQRATLARAAHDGHRLALVVVCLAFTAAVLAAVLARARRRVRVPASAQRAYAAAVVVIAMAGIGLALARFGGPAGLAQHAWHSFAAAPPKTQVDLRKRLYSWSGNGRADLFRAALADGRAHPLLGSGAGSFESYWLAHRPTGLKVRDAHSLYLETFAEHGIVGLILLLAGLAMPLVAAVRARRRPGVAAITGAYVAYLVHAGFDWDWEVPAVTLAALLIGVALLAFARSASRWQPWSTEPWRRLGEAQLAQGNLAAARTSFHKAITKDRGDWSLWFDLARASTGTTQSSALAHASRLNPRSPEIAELSAELAGIDIGVGK